MTTLDPKIEGIIRHVIGILGTIVALTGLGIEVAGLQDAILTLAGSALAIISIVKSWFAKEKTPSELSTQTKALEPTCESK